VSVRKAAVLASLFAFAALGAAQAAHVNPKRGYFGFGPRFADMGDGMAAIRVVDVYDDGPAAPAGVVRGDLIIAIEGAPFRFKGDLELLEWLNRFTAGKPVLLYVKRAGKVVRIPLVPTATPPRYLADLEKFLADAELRVVEGLPVYCEADAAPRSGAAAAVETRPNDYTLSAEFTILIKTMEARQREEAVLTVSKGAGGFAVVVSPAGLAPTHLGVEHLPPKLRDQTGALAVGQSVRFRLQLTATGFKYSLL
jgi:hypothetical protein